MSCCHVTYTKNKAKTKPFFYVNKLHMKLLTCRHPLHLNWLDRVTACQLNLIIPYLHVLCTHCLLRCLLPCRYLTLAPETAEETYVEISDTEPEEPATSASTTTDYPGKGKIYTITWYLSAYLPSCSLERLFDPIHFDYATFKTKQPWSPHPSKTLYC